MNIIHQNPDAHAAVGRRHQLAAEFLDVVGGVHAAAVGGHRVRAVVVGAEPIRHGAVEVAHGEEGVVAVAAARVAGDDLAVGQDRLLPLGSAVLQRLRKLRTGRDVPFRRQRQRWRVRR